MSRSEIERRTTAVLRAARKVCEDVEEMEAEGRGLPSATELALIDAIVQLDLANLRGTFNVGDRVTWGREGKFGDVLQVMTGGRYRVRYEPPGVRATTVIVEPAMNPRVAPARKARQKP